MFFSSSYNAAGSWRAARAPRACALAHSFACTDWLPAPRAAQACARRGYLPPCGASTSACLARHAPTRGCALATYPTWYSGTTAARGGPPDDDGVAVAAAGYPAAARHARPPRAAGRHATFQHTGGGSNRLYYLTPFNSLLHVRCAPHPCNAFPVWRGSPPDAAANSRYLAGSIFATLESAFAQWRPGGARAASSVLNMRR